MFGTENLLREARRQRSLPDMTVPAVCLLDPDGDVVRHLIVSGRGHRHPGWACYYTDMWVVKVSGIEIGVVGMAVGAPCAVLVAEQLAASGAELTIRVTSAGQVTALAQPPCFVLIDRAWRDAGTSAHYRAPGPWSDLDQRLTERLVDAFAGLDAPAYVGASWTTDAP